MRLYYMLCLGVFQGTIQPNNWKWTDIRSIKRNRMNGTDPPQTHKPPFSLRHSHSYHTLKGILGPCGAAREQPSVSCVCSEAGEGRPAPPKESKRHREMGERRGALWKGQGPEWREKSNHKTAFLQRERDRDRHRERERKRRGRLLEQCPFSCRCNG